MSETMRAAVYDRYGPAREVLRVAEIERPEPGAGEVRVRMRVSGVNPTDWKSRAGSPGNTPPFPYLVPNQDGAGEIDAVGEGVDPGRVGQRVWVYFAAQKRQHGAAAQWICLPERQAVDLADSASLDLGASLGIPALTAHHCLFGDGPIDGKTVLVAGGAGAVGHFAIELARRAGARIVTTVSSDEKAAREGAENDFRNHAAELNANFAVAEAERTGRVGTSEQQDAFVGGTAQLCQTEAMEDAQEKADAKAQEQKEKDDADLKAKEDAEKKDKKKHK